MAARGVGSPCNCSVNGFDLVGHAIIEAIFRDFWASGSWNTQTAYVQKQTTTVAVKRRRTNNMDNQKGCTRFYHVPVDDADITVCKTAFVNIHGISRQRLNDRVQKYDIIRRAYTRQTRDNRKSRQERKERRVRKPLIIYKVF